MGIIERENHSRMHPVEPGIGVVAISKKVAVGRMSLNYDARARGKRVRMVYEPVALLPKGR